MAKDLIFSTVLKSLPVKLTGKDEVEKSYTLRELTSTQRASYNESFDFKIEMVEGKAKATAGSDFKMPSAKQFIAMCLYDEEGKIVPEETIGDFPAAVVQELHVAGLELSGMDEKALEKAKNDLEANGISGTE